MEKYLLKLYVTGRTPRRNAPSPTCADLREDLGGQYAMEVIDVLERPQLAEDEKILATPTVVKELPLPDPPHHRRPVGYARKFCSDWTCSPYATSSDPERRER